MVFQQITESPPTQRKLPHVREPRPCLWPSGLVLSLRKPRFYLQAKKKKKKKSASKGSADVDTGCRITAWALHSKEPGQRGTQPSLPPSLLPPAIWHPPLAVQKHLKLFCSQSVPAPPVCRAIWVCITKRFFMARSKVPLIPSCSSFSHLALWKPTLVSSTELCVHALAILSCSPAFSLFFLFVCFSCLCCSLPAY